MNVRGPHLPRGWDTNGRPVACLSLNEDIGGRITQVTSGSRLVFVSDDIYMEKLRVIEMMTHNILYR